MKITITVVRSSDLPESKKFTANFPLSWRNNYRPFRYIFTVRRESARWWRRFFIVSVFDRRKSYLCGTYLMMLLQWCHNANNWRSILQASFEGYIVYEGPPPPPPIRMGVPWCRWTLPGVGGESDCRRSSPELDATKQGSLEFLYCP